MCGICGMFDMKNEHRIDEKILERMTAKLTHRGPDDTDFYISENIGLGFKRLSIIDLVGGKQPIFNEDNSVVLICNGEIYNYLDLKKNLESKGHKFKTKSDVEVLLHLYEEYFTDFLNMLNGQFAFVIYDLNKRTLLCARDHIGIAPFFYTIWNQMFIFGSEIKAILEHPYVERRVDRTGLDQILTFPGLISPRTLFENIYSLENGNYILIRDCSNFIKVEYWDLIYPKQGEIEYINNEDFYIQILEDKITNAVKYRLQADVPVGFYLSGGLDSSVIAAKVKQIKPTQSFNSFSINFPEKDFSESNYQRMMAEHIHSVHHEKVFEIKDIANRLQKSIYHSESPLKETYNTASLALSEIVKENKIKVILTGEGADELFAGYVGYQFDQLRFQNNTLSDPVEEELQKRMWGDSDFFYEKNYITFNETKKAMYSSELAEQFNNFDSCRFPIINKKRLENISLVHKRSYIDFKLRLPDHLLADHGDRMAYANSVEARYPFLDKDLIEFSRLIPSDLKLHNYEEKYIVKKIGFNLVPERIVKRPKFSFVAPGSPHLIRERNQLINDLLSQEYIKRQGYFNPDFIDKLRKQYSQPDFRINLPFENDLLIIVLTFGIFCETFKLR
jgi:asparagine synthase (glutamine-hydrolysing)